MYEFPVTVTCHYKLGDLRQYFFLFLFSSDMNIKIQISFLELKSKCQLDCVFLRTIRENLVPDLPQSFWKQLAFLDWWLVCLQIHSLLLFCLGALTLSRHI